MTDDITYKGKKLADFSLWELELADKEFCEAEAKRDKASKHHKFDKVNNKTAMDFPSPNPQYLKLKQAIHQEFEKRKHDGKIL